MRALLFTFVFCCCCNPCLFAQTRIQDGKLLVADDRGEYQPFFIKGVGYQPTPIGRYPRDWGYLPEDSRRKINNILDDPAILKRDFFQMQQMHANTIRIWKGNSTTEKDGRFPDKLTKRTLDMASAYGLKVIAGFWINSVTFDAQGHIGSTDDRGRPLSRRRIINNFIKYVNEFKDHRAILFWAIGNENNYNRINGRPMNSRQRRAWYALVNDLARAAHQAEGADFHPVAVVNLEVRNIGNPSYGSADTQMPDLDIWGVNFYRGRSFYTAFAEYHQKSAKPLWITEFGVDAWHSVDADHIDQGFEDQDTQAQWTGWLWDEVMANAVVTIGASIMEYSDEWWKSPVTHCIKHGLNHDELVHVMDACNGVQNHIGYDDGGSPGRYASREWFGLMAIKRNPEAGKPDLIIPRKAYFILQQKWSEHSSNADASTPIPSGTGEHTSR